MYGPNPFKEAFLMDVLHGPRTITGMNKGPFILQTNPARHTYQGIRA
jgi:hypothetical protein